MKMDQDKSLREQLRKLLDWEDAHVNFDTAVEGLPRSKRGIIPEGLPYSPWQLVEHIRLTIFRDEPRQKIRRLHLTNPTCVLHHGVLAQLRVI